MEPFPPVEGHGRGGLTVPQAGERQRSPAGSTARPRPAGGPTTTTTTTVTNGNPTTTTASTTTPYRPNNLLRVPTNPATSRPQAVRTPSIRIRRLPSTPSIPQLPQTNESGNDGVQRSGSGRRRSGSAPQRLQEPVRPRTELERQATIQEQLPPVTEEPSRGQTAAALQPEEQTPNTGGRLRSASNATRSIAGSIRRRRASLSTPEPLEREDEYDSRIVDMLDVVDPEVSTMTTLTNVQNSLFVPDLGRWLNRRPTYDLSSRRTTQRTVRETDNADVAKPLPPIPEPSTPLTPYATAQEKQDQERTDLQRSHSLTSVLTESHYAVLPHGATLEGWSDEDKDLLNDHVRHLMHSRRARFKRSMKGFGKYVRRPIGFFITLYAVLITLFGFAWVLFLIGWVNLGNRRLYIINVIDNVLVALFAIMGDGLAPFRAVDTYHMIYIAHYHHLSWRLRKEKQLPKLQDHNDLPEDTTEIPLTEADLEAARQEAEKHEFSVLNSNQQRKLIHHQSKFARSHTFYKPHETETHYAFPLRLLVAVVVLLDCHSLFQIALGTCTWAISYHVRPTSLTTVILCCSIACNITAGIVITVGDRKTRKKEVVERMMRQSLTEDAMKTLKKKGVVPGVVGITAENGEQSTWSKPIENRGDGEGEDFVMWPRAEESKIDEQYQLVNEKRE